MDPPRSACDLLDSETIASVRYAGLLRDARDAQELAGIARALAWGERFSRLAHRKSAATSLSPPRR